MSSLLTMKFILTGPLAGRTVSLGHVPYNFEDGVTTLRANAKDMPLHAQFLERNWQAYPEGHPALSKENEDGQRDLQANGQGDVPGNVQPKGAGAPSGDDADEGAGAAAATSGDAQRVPEGDGPAQSVTNAKLQKAVAALDPEDDTHWTKDGKPAMTAVERLYGSTGITRADVEAAAPGLTRETAKAAAQ